MCLVTQLYLTLCDPREFSRPESWSYPFPSPGDLPNPGIQPRSPTLQADSLSAEPQGKPPLDSYSFLILLLVVTIIYLLSVSYQRASLVAQLIKNLPLMWETWVRSLGWEDPLEKGKATHSSILTWRIPWTVYSMGSQRVV